MISHKTINYCWFFNDIPIPIFFSFRVTKVKVLEPNTSLISFHWSRFTSEFDCRGRTRTNYKSQRGFHWNECVLIRFTNYGEPVHFITRSLLTMIVVSRMFWFYLLIFFFFCFTAVELFVWSGKNHHDF